MQQKYSVNISLDFEASVLVLFTLCEDNLINITMMPSLLVTFQNSVFKNFILLCLIKFTIINKWSMGDFYIFLKFAKN